MPKAIWNGSVIAEAPDDAVEIVEGNVYFPMHAVREDLLQPSDNTSSCYWKGRANYYHVVVDGKVNQDAAWTYRTPSDAAQRIAGHVAFWHGVEVER
ncbi:DUF427 domain-containing protein [Noviherbaspirillum pedocola]|uniref:DUF427 domain-containing protein n=1 Tax=Noviherbaspirillum pedocola TaxID=2801341 RepID=A0A934SZA9_9BURK|nr:DUF427 domain-containing protein [Noviherbaspirillum pedocola]MBK4738424.1 DUF427 domain-containing protein [Noviherbaspirillum pedocola]